MCRRTQKHSCFRSTLKHLQEWPPPFSPWTYLIGSIPQALPGTTPSTELGVAHEHGSPKTNPKKTFHCKYFVSFWHHSNTSCYCIKCNLTSKRQGIPIFIAKPLHHCLIHNYSSSINFYDISTLLMRKKKHLSNIVVFCYMQGGRPSHSQEREIQCVPSVWRL